MTNITHIDQKLLDFFHETRFLSKISDLILAGIRTVDSGRILNDFANHIKPDDESNDMISYIPSGKLSKIGIFEDKNRTKIKVGRFVTKFLKPEISSYYFIDNYEVENFVNLYKGYFNNEPKNTRIAEGHEILKWYNAYSYHAPNGMRCGTLWKSCMRYPEKNSFMELYARNPDKIKMLIQTDSDNKLRSRALLWDCCKDEWGNTYKVMDRIYSIYNTDTQYFKKWASDNGYLYRFDQSAGYETSFVCEGQIMNIRLKTTLTDHLMSKYPYIDTFKFYDINKGEFKNYDDGAGFILKQNDGGLEREENTVDIFDDEDDEI